MTSRQAAALASGLTGLVFALAWVLARAVLAVAGMLRDYAPAPRARRAAKVIVAADIEAIFHA